MTHRIYRVRNFQIVGPYMVCVGFDDGSQRVIDFRNVLAGDLFGPLRDLNVFNKVTIDLEVHTLVWPNGADFDPATLHDWPEHIESLTDRCAALGTPSSTDVSPRLETSVAKFLFEDLCRFGRSSQGLGAGQSGNHRRYQQDRAAVKPLHHHVAVSVRRPAARQGPASRRSGTLAPSQKSRRCERRESVRPR